MYVSLEAVKVPMAYDGLKLSLSCQFPLLGLLKDRLGASFQSIILCHCLWEDALSWVGNRMLLCTAIIHYCCGWILGPNIKDVLQFITGKSEMPVLPRITFHGDKSKTLPDPDTSLCSVKLPLNHSTLKGFTTAFDATVTIQGVGYGHI